MKKLILALLVIALAVSAIYSDNSEDDKIFNPPNSNVTNLEDKTFDDFLGQHEFVLVEFYAPWCPHCKQLVPAFEEAAAKLKGKVPLAKIDCDKNREIAGKFQIPGFPTLKLFKNGKPFRDYEDPDRTGAGFVRWVEKKTGPSAFPVKGGEVQEFVEAHKAETNAVVIGSFNSKDSEEFKAFSAAADDLDDFVFGEVIDESVTKPSVTVYKAKEKEVSTETVDSTLANFIKENGYPLIDEVNGKTFQRFASSGLPLAVIFFDAEKEGQLQSSIDLLNKAATELKGKFNFGYSDGNIYGEQLELMGGDKSNLPGLAAMNLETRKNFPYTGDLDAEKIFEWANGILSGKVEPFLRSEPIPETNDEPVKVVVGKSFDSIVMDDSKDVLVEFYAPWCGHCQKLAPKYEELATFFAPVENLVIAKIDSTQNDSPVQIEGFPTIIFFPAGKKSEPVNYEGNRSLSDMKKFIKKNASEKVREKVKELMEAAKKKNAEQSLEGEKSEEKPEAKEEQKTTTTKDEL